MKKLFSLALALMAFYIFDFGRIQYLPETKLRLTFFSSPEMPLIAFPLKVLDPQYLESLESWALRRAPMVDPVFLSNISYSSLGSNKVCRALLKLKRDSHEKVLSEFDIKLVDINNDFSSCSFTFEIPKNNQSIFLNLVSKYFQSFAPRSPSDQFIDLSYAATDLLRDRNSSTVQQSLALTPLGFVSLTTEQVDDTKHFVVLLFFLAIMAFGLFRGVINEHK